MRIPRYVFALAFIAALGAMVIMMVVTARGYGEAARTMPLVVGIPTIVFILVQLVSDGVRVARGDATVGTTSEEEQDRYLHGAKSEGVQRASVPTAVSSTREDRSTSMLGAMLWVGALIGLSVGNPQVAASAGLIWLFPVVFLSNAFVPPDTMPTVVRNLAEWNPISALVAGARDLFGNEGVITSEAWPMQNPVLAAFLWCVLIIVIFAPLAVRKYKAAASK
jgi:hypothetical protein